MQFSVLITTIGSGTLEMIVRTYLNDTQDDFEIIIVVDNPGLNRSELPSLAGDKRLRIIYNDHNIGLTRSLNRGLATAFGDVIVRNDDDDLPSASRLQTLREFFADNPGVDVVSSYATGISESKNERWELKTPLDDWSIKAELVGRNILVASSVAIRRSAIRDVGGYCEQFRFAQDYELYLRLIRAGKIFACIPEFLVERHYSETSITVQKRKTQALYSFAARLIHAAETKGHHDAAVPIARYAMLLLVPNALRKFRRRLGRGR